MPYKNHEERKRFHREYMREYNKTHALTEEQKKKKSLANKLWREKNKERLADYQHKRWRRDKEKIVLRKKARAEREPEAEKKQRQKSYQKNKDKALSRSKLYYAQNTEKIREYKRIFALRPRSRFCGYKRRAAKRGFEFELTEDIFCKLIASPCHYCGEKGYGVDRKDSSIGYTLNNSLPCCKECNYMKSDMTYENFLARIKSIYLNLN